MSLPPGFLDELRARVSIAQVVGRKVVWDARKSNQSKGDMWAPCPFHQEKTASFHVDDPKGYYYCFGCHAKGDAIGFVKETENVGFMEAVEILAAEAGMQMPAPDPKARQKASRQSELIDVLDQANQFFRLQLKTAAGAEARDYLLGRGLHEEAVERWEIGFAQNAWQGLWDHLRAKSVSEELILATGLAKPSQKGGKPYDTFRNRIMFPIRDGRGRAIAFGGRAMDPSDSAKYLNSPETEVFDKSRTLFNLVKARAAAGKGQPLLVAEGYMDVIALSEAGLEAVVAPLGTAVTDTQLQMLWRVSDEPIVALDGDAAGLRAAIRLIDMALPMLAPERSLRFCQLPEGQDPDDLIRAQGVEAMRRLVSAAKPLVHLLWQRETSGKVFDSPERRAGLDQALRKALGQIADSGLRNHYAAEIKRLRSELFDTGQNGKRSHFVSSKKFDRSPAQATRSSRLAGPENSEMNVGESIIVPLLIKFPELIVSLRDKLEAFEMSRLSDQEILNELLAHDDELDPDQASEVVVSKFGIDALEKTFASGHVKNTLFICSKNGLAATERTVLDQINKIQAQRGLQIETDEFVEDFASLDSGNEVPSVRLGEASEAKNKILRDSAKSDEDDTEDRRTMSQHLQSLEDGEVWVKKKG